MIIEIGENLTALIILLMLGYIFYKLVKLVAGK